VVALFAPFASHTGDYIASRSGQVQRLSIVGLHDPVHSFHAIVGRHERASLLPASPHLMVSADYDPKDTGAPPIPTRQSIGIPHLWDRKLFVW